jgi:hypothetical protein
MAKKDVVKLLVQLFGDPDHLKRIQKDPETVMDAAGLDEAENALLRSRNEAAIKSYLGADAASANIKTKALANIKSKTAIQGAMANIKSKTTAVKGEIANIKAKTRAVKGEIANIKTKTKK